MLTLLDPKKKKRKIVPSNPRKMERSKDGFSNSREKNGDEDMKREKKRNTKGLGAENIQKRLDPHCAAGVRVDGGCMAS